MPNNTYINKVVYGGNTLIDLTSDTAVASDVLSGKYFHLKSGERVQGSCDYDMDTSSATADASEILYGNTAGVNGTMVTGSMPNNGGNNVVVTDASGTTIPAGYYDGSGKAKIDTTSASVLLPGNIKDGVTILGVVGTFNGQAISVQNNKNASASTSAAVEVTPDSGYDYLAKVTIAKISYVEADNAAGGKTATIAGS